MIPARIGDHAFANGMVFRDPGGTLAAMIATRGWGKAFLLCSVWRQFRNQALIEDGARLSLSARLVNHGTREQVVIQSRAIVRGILNNEKNGRIEIGHDAYIGDDVIISAALEVMIGAHTMIAHGVQVFDNNTHPIDPIEREIHLQMILGQKPQRDISVSKAPVHIGQRCWIGMNSIVLKGVTIGENTIVGAGSVVVSDLPSNVVAAGNPARIVKYL